MQWGWGENNCGGREREASSDSGRVVQAGAACGRAPAQGHRPLWAPLSADRYHPDEDFK